MQFYKTPAAPAVSQYIQRFLRHLALVCVALFAGAQTGVMAQAGQSMDFDGVNDQVDLPVTLLGSYTKEVWIKVNAITGLPQNILSGNTTAVYVDGAGNLGGGNLVELSDGTGSLIPGQWYHVAVTYDVGTGTLVLYKNGVAVDTKPGAFYGFEPILQIGAYQSAFHFGGQIDEVRVWNVVRSAAEIAASYNCEISHTSPGLAAYYTFNQGIAAGNNTAITSVLDVNDVCNPLNGTINGFALNGATSNFVSSQPPSFTGVCSATPEIRLVGLNGNCIDDGDNTPAALDGTDFGIIVQSPLERTFTIRNNGTGTLNVTAFASSNPTDFTVNGSLPMNIAPGSSETFTVTFNPTLSYGIKTSTITITSNDSDEASYEFDVQGNNAARGASLDFDGLFSFVQTPVNITGSYTKELWINPRTVGAGVMNLLTGNSTAVYIDAAGNLGGGNLIELSDGTGALVAGQWYHVAVTYDAGTGTLKLFKNGALVDTEVGGAYGSDLNLQIGAFNSAFLFDGKIDEVRIWSVARTDAEIAASYMCNIADDAAGLIAYYDFNQGTAGLQNSSETVLKDRTCNKLDAVLFNFQLNGLLSNWVAEGSPAATSCVLSNIRVEGLQNCITDGDITPSATDGTDFGFYAAPGIDRTFCIKNTGGADLTINSVIITGVNASAFTITTPPASTILPGDSSCMVIRFASTVNGPKFATVNIDNNDTDESLFTFDVVGEGIGPVPVSLLSFTGAMNQKVVDLKWNTSNEVNNAGFEVLRSGPNQDSWVKIGFVPASGLTAATYTLTDYAPLPGTNTYRLRQLDVDGREKFSNIIAVNNTGTASLVRAYPNPFKDQFTLVFNSRALLNTRAVILNSQGVKVAYVLLNNFNQNINLSKLAPGMYFVQLANGEVVRVVKQ